MSDPFPVAAAPAPAARTGNDPIPPAIGAAGVLRVVSAAIWIAGSAAVAAAALVALQYLRHTSLQPWRGASTLPRTDLAAAAAILALAAAAVGVAYVLAGRRPLRAAVFGFTLLVGTRLAMAVLFDGRLFSDYAGYRSIANGMLAGQGFWTSVPPGYPLLEAVAMAIAGGTALAGELLNLALSVGAGAAVYLLARRGWGDRAAAVALTTFAITPSQILFTLVLGTEITYGALLVVVAVLARRALSSRWRVAAACGMLVGLSQYVRPTSLVLIPTLVLVFLLFAASRRSWIRPAIALTLAFSITVLPIVAWNATVNGRLSASPSLFDKWTIYIGLNVASRGQYRSTVRAEVAAAAGVPVVPDDGGVPGALFSARRLAQARAFNDAAGDLLPQKIRSNGQRSLSIQPMKFRAMWQNADYPVDLVFGPLSPQPAPEAAAIASLLAQAVWVVVLLAALIGLWRFRHDRRPEAVIVLLVILGAVAIHALAEVQPRYHEYFVPLITVLAGATVSRGSGGGSRQSDDPPVAETARLVGAAGPLG